MATAIPRHRSGGGARRDPFYPVMALAIAVVVAAGFGPSYAESLAPPGLPFWVHLHGAAMTCWIALFAAQSWLVRRRQMVIHRRLGWASLGLVAMIVPLGVATDMLAVRRGATPPFFTPAGMMAADWCDLAAFTGLFVAAVILRRQADWHKRLLLTATVLLTYPALGRLPIAHMAGFDLVVPIATAMVVSLALVGPAHDLVRRRRVHPAYGWAVGAVVVAHALSPLVGASAPMRALAGWLVG